MKYTLQYVIDKVYDEIMALKVSLYNSSGAITEANPLPVADAKTSLLHTILSAVYNATLGALKVTLATSIAGENHTYNVMETSRRVLPSGPYTDTTYIAGPLRLAGIFVSSVSDTPSLEIYNATTTDTGKCVNAFTPEAGKTYEFGGMELAVGCRVKKVSGTVAFTVMYEPLVAAS